MKLCIRLLVLFLAFTVVSETHAQSNPWDIFCQQPGITLDYNECYALNKLHDSYNGQSRTRHDNRGISPDISTWYGVQVEGSHVVGIVLPNNNIYSEHGIDLFIAFPNLRVLDLSSNHIGGELYSWNFNELDHLKVLNLHNNQLEGSIPQEVGDLFQLEVLDLHNNNFSVSDVPDLSNLGRLRYLSLHTNRNLEGNGMSIAGPRDIEHLYLNKTHISEPLNDGFSRREKLQYLDVSDSDASLAFEAVDARNNVLLTYLNIDETTDIRGNPQNFPEDISPWSNLAFLSVKKALKAGNFSDELMKIFESGLPLRWLILSDNRGEGKLPNNNARSLTSLETLDLSNNQLDGEVWDKISDLTALRSLSLANNNFEYLSSKMGYLQLLENLDIRNNNLQGGMPSGVGEGGTLKTLFVKGSPNFDYATLPAEAPTKWVNIKSSDWVYVDANGHVQLK